MADESLQKSGRLFLYWDPKAESNRGRKISWVEREKLAKSVFFRGWCNEDPSVSLGCAKIIVRQIHAMYDIRRVRDLGMDKYRSALVRVAAWNRDARLTLRDGAPTGIFTPEVCDRLFAVPPQTFMDFFRKGWWGQPATWARAPVDGLVSTLEVAWRKWAHDNPDGARPNLRSLAIEIVQECNRAERRAHLRLVHSRR